MSPSDLPVPFEWPAEAGPAHEPLLVPADVAAEAAAIRAAGQALKARLDEGARARDVAPDLCTLLDRIDAAGGRIPDPGWATPNLTVWDAAMRLPLFASLGARFDAEENDWCLGEAGQAVLLSCYGSRWEWEDEPSRL